MTVAELQVAIARLEIKIHKEQEKLEDLIFNLNELKDELFKIKRPDPKPKFKVYCVETRESFISTMAAAKKYRLSPKHVKRACETGEEVLSKHFEYLED